MEKNKKTANVDSIKLGKQLYYFMDGMLEEAKLLATDLDCDVNWVNCRGDTPLIVASFRGHSNVVKVLLLRQDLLVNHQDEVGEPALIHASRTRRIECVELLLDDPRTDVNLVNMNGCSALWFAYYYSHVSMMKLLISHGANVEEVAESLLKFRRGFYQTSIEATEVMENWKLYLPEFTRIAKTNKYYPTEFKEWAFNFILCCLKSKSFPKDIIYLLLEYIARAWKKIK